MPRNTLFQRIILPGLLMQSVMIGGGYATGRELVEFFLSNGPLGGLLGLLTTMAMISVISAIGFEFARLARSYDYRSFFRALLGRGWFLWEVAYFPTVLLVLAVLGAASGELVATHFGIEAAYGIIGMMLLIGILVFWGTGVIERVLAGWSFVLYATYGVLIVLYLARFGDALAPNFSADALDGNWLHGSLAYLGYNVAAMPVILFCVRHMESRRDAFTAGLLCGPLSMTPALLFFLGMAASYPEIVAAPVPSDFMIQALELGWMEILFYLVVFGTFVETGTALIHAINERLSSAWSEGGRALPRWLRPVVAAIALIIAIVLAGRFGLIDLVARGYGTLTWLFIAVFVVPVMTLGVWRICSGRLEPSRSELKSGHQPQPARERP